MRSFVAACVISAVALAGCACEEPSKGTEQSGFIAVVGAGEGDPLWPVLAATATRHVAGWDSIPVRIEAPRLVSSNAQNELIRKLEAEGMRALCVQVVDVDGARALLESLRRRGVEVVTMVREVRVSPPFHHCGWDEQALGELMADALGEALFGEGVEVISDPTAGMKEIAIVAPSALLASAHEARHDQQTGAAIQRYRGFRRKLAKRSAIEVFDERACDDASKLPAAMLAGGARIPTLDAWVLADGWSAGRVPPELDRLIRDRIVVLPHPLPSMWSLTDTEARVIAVGADYGAVAPLALDQAAAMLHGGMSRRRNIEVDLAVITERDWAAYRARFARWCDRKPIGNWP